MRVERIIIRFRKVIFGKIEIWIPEKRNKRLIKKEV
jgi:hypothetical protein